MVYLRKMEENDIDFVISCLKDTTERFMSQWGGGACYEYPVTSEQVQKRFNNRDENIIYFIIMNDDQAIGSVELTITALSQRECTVNRFMIAEQWRSKGYGTMALNLLKEYAFNNMRMKKLLLSVAEHNVGAIKCYENAGFHEYDRVSRIKLWKSILMEIVNTTA